MKRSEVISPKKTVVFPKTRPGLGPIKQFEPMPKFTMFVEVTDKREV